MATGCSPSSRRRASPSLALPPTIDVVSLGLVTSESLKAPVAAPDGASLPNAAHAALRTSRLRSSDRRGGAERRTHRQYPSSSGESRGQDIGVVMLGLFSLYAVSATASAPAQQLSPWKDCGADWLGCCRLETGKRYPAQPAVKFTDVIEKNYKNNTMNF